MSESLQSTSANIIAGSKVLRKKLFNGEYPEELKRKVAALVIENWVICNALSRYTDMIGRPNPTSKGKFLHGIVHERPYYLSSFKFYWFGKQHGYYESEGDSTDANTFGWYYLGKQHGPCVYPYTQWGDEKYEEWDKGEKIYNERLPVNDPESWDAYDNFLYNILNYDSDSWVCNEASNIVWAHAESEFRCWPAKKR